MAKTAIGGMDFGGDWEKWLRILLALSALGLPIPAKWKMSAAALLLLSAFLR
jgi:hypothetical protein